MNNTKILNTTIDQFKDAFARLNESDKNIVSNNLYKVLRSRVRDEHFRSDSMSKLYKAS